MNEEILQEIENFGASESLKEKIKTIMNKYDKKINDN